MHRRVLRFFVILSILILVIALIVTKIAINTYNLQDQKQKATNLQENQLIFPEKEYDVFKVDKKNVQTFTGQKDSNPIEYKSIKQEEEFLVM